MIKILTVVGTRPQFIKAATMSRCIKEHFPDKLREVIMHSGQHYDKNMSDQFFKELNIPQPAYYFSLKNFHPVEQINEMRGHIELAIQNEKPDLIILYGDTNTTLAGTYAASNSNIPIAHIEAGLRSYDNSMPEEFNRYTCDHASTLLFAPTEKAFQNLIDEGASAKNKKPYNSSKPGLFLSGDVMYDSFLFASGKMEHQDQVLNKFGLQKDKYILATIHRNFNTDKKERLNNILKGLDKLSKTYSMKIVVPLHPRTKKRLDNTSLSWLKNNSLIKLIEPLSYFSTIAIGMNSKIIITDSGGLQKEAFFMQKPCLILRSSTEWAEIVENGNALLVNTDPEKMIKGYEYFSEKDKLTYPLFFGNGEAAKFICKRIIKSLK